MSSYKILSWANMIMHTVGSTDIQSTTCSARGKQYCWQDGSSRQKINLLCKISKSSYILLFDYGLWALPSNPVSQPWTQHIWAIINMHELLSCGGIKWRWWACLCAGGLKAGWVTQPVSCYDLGWDYWLEKALVVVVDHEGVWTHDVGIPTFKVKKPVILVQLTSKCFVSISGASSKGIKHTVIHQSMRHPNKDRPWKC